MHMCVCAHTDWVKLNPHVKCIGHPFTQEWERCLLCVRMYVYVHVMPTGLLQSSQGFLSATTEEEREGDWDRVVVPTFLSHLCNILFPSPSPLKPVSPLTQDQFTTVIMQLTPIKSFHCKNVCVHMYICACVHVCALSMLMCVYTHMIGQLQQHKGAFWKRRAPQSTNQPSDGFDMKREHGPC